MKHYSCFPKFLNVLKNERYFCIESLQFGTTNIYFMQISTDIRIEFYSIVKLRDKLQYFQETVLSLT